MTRNFLRLRSGIALAILLAAACVAVFVTHIGRVNVDQREAVAAQLDTALIAASQSSRLFDQFVRNDGLVNRANLRSELRVLADRMSAALDQLNAIRQDSGFAAETENIVELPSVNPLGLLEEIVLIANRIAAGDQSPTAEERLGSVGGKLADRLSPVLLRMKETERIAFN